MLLTALSLPELAQRTILKPDFNIFTIAQDAEFGRIAAAEIEAQSAILQNALLSDTSTRLAGILPRKLRGETNFVSNLD